MLVPFPPFVLVRGDDLDLIACSVTKISYSPDRLCRSLFVHVNAYCRAVRTLELANLLKGKGSAMSHFNVQEVSIRLCLMQKS